MIMIKNNRLWNGSADIREDKYEMAIQRGERIQFLTPDRPGETMTISASELKKEAYTTGKEYYAKFPLANGKNKYKIYSIKWKPDKIQQSLGL